MSDYQYDLVIVGAGPGGYEAAYEAAAYGMKVALVEKDRLGGTCLNRGCIPTKAIMHASGLARAAREGAACGVEAASLRVDPDQVYAYKESVLGTLRDGIAAGLKKHKVDLIPGTAVVTGAHELRVMTAEPAAGAERLTAAYILIATGSVPVIPPIPGAELPGVIDSTALLEHRGQPYRDLVIIGGGVIGVEFATVYHGFGAHVTIIEALDRLLATLDKELGRSLKMSFQQAGIDVLTKCPVARIEEADGRLSVVYAGKDGEAAVPADAVLMAVGRRPYTAGLLGPDLTALLDERGQLPVNEHYQTAVPSIYAVGDAIGGIQLAHVATAEGRNAVAHMNSRAATIDMATVPSCIYSMPEIATVGLSADEAKAQGIPVVTRKYAMGANSKTVIESLGRGFIKLVATEQEQRLVGAQLMCGRATDLIGELAVAVAHGMTLDEVARVIHPHPSFAEAIADAARAR